MWYLENLGLIIVSACLILCGKLTTFLLLIGGTTAGGYVYFFKERSNNLFPASVQWGLINLNFCLTFKVDFHVEGLYTDRR